MSKELSLSDYVNQELVTGKDIKGNDIVNPEKYGSAEISAAEIKAVRKLYKTIRENTFGEIATLNVDQKKRLRELVVQSIIDDGWPKLENLNTKDLAQTAVSHACIVVESLYQKRGPESLPDLVWSYSTKNQFDRYVQKILQENQKLSTESILSEEWNSPSKRAEIKTEGINYPDKVDDNLIHGIGKATRYWPAQLMRYLESIRLKKSGPEEITKYKVGDTDRKKYKVPWSSFDEVIIKAQKIEDITVGVALKTLEILKSHGLSNEQLIATISNAYSPTSVIGEHGHISEISSVWNRLLEEVRTNPKLANLYPALEQEYKNKIK